MKLLILLFLSTVLVSCEFERADYYEYRYGSNVDFGDDVGNRSGSTFDFGSSYKSTKRSGNTRIYMGTTESTQDNGKKDYSRYYRGSAEED